MANDRINSVLALIAGLGLGAAVMYFLDPERGARRRHLALDKTRSSLKRGGRGLHDAIENAKNHSIGAVREARARLSDESIEDDRLVDRVRAELGHRVEHPRAIEVVAENGTITLTGRVPAEEVDRAFEAVSRVRGVRGVDNRLEVGAPELPRVAGPVGDGATPPPASF